MTLGQKLAGYRKLAGLTQQQLGEYLNISAQAISKWEKDLSEPAIATLRALAELYKVSLDELLNPNAGFSDMSAFSNEEEYASEEPLGEGAAMPIGFCKHCGITVSEENLGTTQPVVLCKSCLAEMERQELLAAEAERRQREEAERSYQYHLEANRSRRRRHRTLALWVAGGSAAALLAATIVAMVLSSSGAWLFLSVVGLYPVFSFAFCMFYDCIVQEMVWDWFDKSLSLPGLITTFDLDGFVWLIGMKILFWFLGILFGIITGLIGIFLGLCCAPFVFPFLLRKESRGIANGEALES